MSYLVFRAYYLIANPLADKWEISSQFDLAFHGHLALCNKTTKEVWK